MGVEGISFSKIKIKTPKCSVTIRKSILIILCKDDEHTGPETVCQATEMFCVSVSNLLLKSICPEAGKLEFCKSVSII